MSIAGKKSIHISKTDLQSQKTLARSFRNLRFFHQATLADTSINLAALVFPSGTDYAPLSNPTVTELNSAELSTYRNNLMLHSSLSGWLSSGSYKVASNMSITLSDPAEDGEIFEGVIISAPRSGSLVADTNSILVTGSLAANGTDINVGSSFKTNANSSKQVGKVMVIVDGQMFFRNVGNATASLTADGDYQEVDNGYGECSLIRLNQSSDEARPYIVMSTVLSTIEPNGSITQELQRQSGVIDTLVSVLSVVSGLPTTYWQVTPTQPQLTQFGQRVLDLETRDNKLEDPTLQSDIIATKLGQKAYAHGTTYNGGFAPTVTYFSGGGALSSVNIAQFIPYQMQDGTWRMRFNVEVITDSVSRTSLTLTINGVTFFDTGTDGQAIAGWASTAVNAAYAYAPSNTGRINATHASISTNHYFYSGDCKLATKPTWAY